MQIFCHNINTFFSCFNFVANNSENTVAVVWFTLFLIQDEWSDGRLCVRLSPFFLGELLLQASLSCSATLQAGAVAASPNGPGQHPAHNGGGGGL